MPEASVAEGRGEPLEAPTVEGQADAPPAAEAEGRVELPEAATAEGQVDLPADYLTVLYNSMGVFDGDRFYLRSFPVWDAWKPEVGSVDGIWFAQTMGRMVLWYELSGRDEALTEEDLVVEMSSWQLRVSVGRDVPAGRPGPRKISALCGELYGDVRRKLSWWEISDNEDYPGTWLVITLAKLEHKAWNGPWYEGPLNPHRKSTFGWAPLHISEHLAKMLKPEDEWLQRVPAGEPEELIKNLYTGMLPERLCTGIEDDEGDTAEQISVLLHLGEEALELVSGLVPLEELFAAEVEPDRLDVFLRFDGFSLCTGTLTGFVVPELTSWEITNVRRKELSSDSGIKSPAFYNPALRITLVKALDYQEPWGHAFASRDLPKLQPPTERTPWMGRMMRAAALSPAAPFQVTAKTERAQRLCTHVECSQDRYKASVVMHLEDRLEETLERFRIDITTFFSMRVGEQVLELNVAADAEYRMCVGGLGGKCLPEKTVWQITRERSRPDEEREHLALRVELAKASRGLWKEVFTRWEPWQVSEAMFQALQEQLQIEADRPLPELPQGHEPAELAGALPAALGTEEPAEEPLAAELPPAAPAEGAEGVEAPAAERLRGEPEEAVQEQTGDAPAPEGAGHRTAPAAGTEEEPPEEESGSTPEREQRRAD